MQTYLRKQRAALVVLATLALQGHPSAASPSLTAVGSFAPAASPAAPLEYVEPAPIRVYRSYVYATMKSRRNKIVTVESLVRTSSVPVAEGEAALLERRLEPQSADGSWAPVADVVVKKLLAKGRIELEIQLDHTDDAKQKKRPAFAAGQKVRLQIDRKTPPPS